MPWNPNQPRVPAGVSEGGEWTDDSTIIAARTGAGLPVWPKIPEGASQVVREAYTVGLSPNRVGITDADKRELRKAVKRGDLVYDIDYRDWFQKKKWQPVLRPGK